MIEKPRAILGGRRWACIGLMATALTAGCLVVAGCGGGDEDTTTLPAAVPAVVKVTVVPVTDVPEVATPTEVEPTDEPATETSVPEATSPPAPPTAVPATAVPSKFLNLSPGEDRDCDEFDGQAEAQAYWNYHRSEQWPNPGRLDGNGNGVVCEDTDRSAPAAPPAPQPAVAQPSRPCNTDLTCGDFGSWQEMNDWWNACGRPDKYDKNGDGIPCESLR